MFKKYLEILWKIILGLVVLWIFITLSNAVGYTKSILLYFNVHADRASVGVISGLIVFLILLIARVLFFSFDGGIYYRKYILNSASEGDDGDPEEGILLSSLFYIYMLYIAVVSNGLFSTYSDIESSLENSYFLGTFLCSFFILICLESVFSSSKNVSNKDERYLYNSNYSLILSLNITVAIMSVFFIIEIFVNYSLMGFQWLLISCLIFQSIKSFILYVLEKRDYLGLNENHGIFVAVVDIFKYLKNGSFSFVLHVLIGAVILFLMWFFPFAISSSYKYFDSVYIWKSQRIAITSCEDTFLEHNDTINNYHRVAVSKDDMSFGYDTALISMRYTHDSSQEGKLICIVRSDLEENILLDEGNRAIVVEIYQRNPEDLSLTYIYSSEDEQ